MRRGVGALRARSRPRAARSRSRSSSRSCSASARLTLLFLGSAVVVLERFARERAALAASAARWWRSRCAALLAALGTDDESVEALGIAWPGALRPGSRAARRARAARARAGRRSRCAALRAARALARGARSALGARLRAACVGGVGQLGYAAAPAVVAARRRARARAGAGAARGAPARRRRAARPPRSPRRSRSARRSPLALPAPDARVASAGGCAARRVRLRGGARASLPLAAAGFLDSRGSVEWFIARALPLREAPPDLHLGDHAASASPASPRASG